MTVIHDTAARVSSHLVVSRNCTWLMLAAWSMLRRLSWVLESLEVWRKRNGEEERAMKERA